jgi:hypothetical protein
LVLLPVIIGVGILPKLKVIVFDSVIDTDDVPNKLPVNPKVDIIDPVTIKLPVIIALPVYGKDDPLPPPPEPVLTVIGNVEPSPLVKVIVFKLTEAVVSKEPVSKLPVPGGPCGPVDP